MNELKKEKIFLLKLIIVTILVNVFGLAYAYYNVDLTDLPENKPAILAEDSVPNLNGFAMQIYEANQKKEAQTIATDNAEVPGLFNTFDDYGISYYFKGPADGLNNNVLFAGYEWKIIRIDGNGHIRMIYNGKCRNLECTDETINGIESSDSTSIGNVAFNNRYADNAYVGYLYGEANNANYSETHANTHSSTIKEIVDAFYTALPENAKEKIILAEYCNNRKVTNEKNYSGNGTKNTSTSYGRYRFYTNNLPTLKCEQAKDRISLKIALITADEVALAGGVYNSSNHNHYLQTNQNYWTMSPYYFTNDYAHGLIVHANGSLINTRVDYPHGVRPVITIDSSDTIADGNGSTTNPYRISVN